MRALPGPWRVRRIGGPSNTRPPAAPREGAPRTAKPTYTGRVRPAVPGQRYRMVRHPRYGPCCPS
eukprot:8250858-Alexandrium_andersonii.AAC.1